ncbi:lipoyltransferase [Delitschia confertaspora ATCC 74209]|uniref:Octanoyltransferase n=1 Tax=Delitschia confertaspora ATCC 74209 TaxID=1513339 RepID=A0A9P4MVA7_9PLEO|nr:lipoyltransferase [Delitschia confertaspora ATCC 74209]
MRLHHLHFKNVIPYAKASTLQESIVSKFLAAKPPSTLQPPPPSIITAQFHEVYTCGRREIGKVSPEQQAFLRHGGKAEFVEAMRGGQTTFHGPGQLIAYPIIDLRTHRLTPRDYVCMLEKSLIATCARFGIKAMTTEHTGVWTSPDDKIASIGVHMRRNITSHGIALNIKPDLWWFDRIVACGLEGKRATSFEKMGVRMEKGADEMVQEVGGVFVEEMGKRLGIEQVDYDALD